MFRQHGDLRKWDLLQIRHLHHNSITADIAMGVVSGGMAYTGKLTHCMLDTTTASEICDQPALTGEVETLKTQLGGVIENVNIDCDSLEAGSSAAGFGFGAFLVSIFYMMF